MSEIERCLAQLDRIAELIEDTVGDDGDDSVQWPMQIREVAVEIARLTRHGGQ
jgi:hypothetical protein